ncbi:MAG: hypothetical protein N3C60_03535 [Calditerrivibrio sp.]|nr:hypothetical protein [Calditerrivibrio sp.]
MYKRILMFPTLKEASYVFKKRFDQNNGLLCLKQGDVLACVIGVSKSASLINTYKVFESYGADEYFLLGIGGAYRKSGLKVGDVVTIMEDYFVDEGVFLGDKLMGLDEMGFAICEKNRVFFKVWEDLKIVTGNTVSVCSGTDFWSDMLQSKTNADVETMEGASVGLVAMGFGRDVYHIRAISNFTGERRNQEWNFMLAMDNLSDFIRRNLL